MGCIENKEPTNEPYERLKLQCKSVHINQLVVARLNSIFDDYKFMNYISRSDGCYRRQIKHKKISIERTVKVYSRTPAHQEKAMNEINIMKNLDYPHVERILEYFTDKSNIYLVFEKTEGQELFNYILGVNEEARSNFPQIFYQLLLALNYIHTRGFAHCNIQPSNINVTKKQHQISVKLIDFSLAKSIRPKQKSNRSSNHNDIIIEDLTLDNAQKKDIWMAGLILLMILTGQNFISQSKQEKVIHALNEWKQQNQDLGEIGDLLTKMLDENSDDRPSARQCLNHCFFKNEKGNDKYRWRAALAFRFLYNFEQKNRFKQLFQLHMLHRLCPSSDKNQFAVQFANLDKNKNGVLEENELIEGFSQIFNISHEKARQHAKNILQKLDRNGNGSLDYSEFSLGTTNVNKLVTQSNMREIFKQLDVNNDGFVTLQQMRGMFYELNCEKLESMLKSLPERGINLSQFRQFIFTATVEPLK